MSRGVQFRVFLILLISLGMLPTGQGADPTGEEEAWMAYNNGRHPLALNRTGTVLFHVDSKPTLHRRNVRTGQVMDSFPLPYYIASIATSDSETRVALAHSTECVGIVDLALQRQPKHTSLSKRIGKSLFDTPILSACSDADNEQGYTRPAIALSRDGSRLAIEGRPIRIFDSISGKLVATVPVGEEGILSLRFLDKDSKLLVVQAKLGQGYEPPSTGSDMQFLVWDLKRAELLTMHRTATGGDLLSYDYMWSYSELSGQLWAFQTDGEYWQTSTADPNKQELRRVTPHTVQLNQCASPRVARPSLPPAEVEMWRDFAADPLGRWLVTIDSFDDPKERKVRSRMKMWSASDGKLLMERKLSGELTSLTPSINGETLFGVLAGQPSAEEMGYMRYRRLYRGGGDFVQIDLRPALPPVEPRFASLPWPAQPCTLEDEQQGAREIHSLSARFSKRHEVSLKISGSWGIGLEDRLWVERENDIAELVPETGKVRSSIMRPTTASSIPVYEWEKFITYQGDTIATRPFNTPSERKVLVRKLGWHAWSVSWTGSSLNVIWVSKKVENAKQREAIPNAAVAASYDRMGNLQSEVTGSYMPAPDSPETYGGIPLDDLGNPDYGYDHHFSQAIDPEPNRYAWSKSYANSLRAQQKLPDGSTSTVFWSGLHMGQPGSALAPVWVELLTQSGSPIAAVTAHERDTLHLLDAKSRTRPGMLKVKGAVRVAGLPDKKLVMVEVIDESSKFRLMTYEIRKTP